MKEENIDKIKPYPQNAKKHPKKQIEQIADSIKEFGFNQPLVIDMENVIIVGHGRYEAAHLLKMKKVPVIQIDISEAKARAYRLADNKLNESDWEMAAVIAELSTMDERLIELTGFDKDLVKKLKEDEATFGGFTKPPRTQRGDLYELGPHKLLCGDSTEEADYLKLMGAEKARLVFTDPPYSVDYVSTAGLTYDSQKFGDSGKIFNDDKTPEEALGFYTTILKCMHKFTTDDVNMYWWFASRLTDINMDAFKEGGWHFSQIILWLKNSLIYSPGQLYHRIYEPCMVGWKEGQVHYKDTLFSSYTELWTLDRKTFAEHLDVWYQKRDNTSRYIHPTQKPVALAERALKRSSEINDIVLDAFGGSGSTMMACEQMDRRARLIELDPKYCDAIVQRYVDYTSNTDVTKNGKVEIWEISESEKKRRQKLKTKEGSEKQ